MQFRFRIKIKTLKPVIISKVYLLQLLRIGKDNLDYKVQFDIVVSVCVR